MVVEYTITVVKADGTNTEVIFNVENRAEKLTDLLFGHVLGPSAFGLDHMVFDKAKRVFGVDQTVDPPVVRAAADLAAKDLFPRKAEEFFQKTANKFFKEGAAPLVKKRENGREELFLGKIFRKGARGKAKNTILLPHGTGRRKLF